MASCASCGKHPLNKNRKGVRACRRCGPKPVMVNGRPVLAALAAAMALAGCQDDGRQEPTAFPGIVRIWTDPETGCEYIRAPASSFTPRLRADGTPKCSPPA